MAIRDHGVPVLSSRQWTTGLSPNADGTGWNYIVDYIGDPHPHQWMVLRNFTTSPVETTYETLQGIYPNIEYGIGVAKGQLRAANGRIFFPQVRGYTAYYEPTDETIHQIGPVAETPPIDQNASTQFYAASFDVGGLLYFATQESHNRPACVVVTDTDTLEQTVLGYVGDGALSFTTYGFRIAPDTATADKYIYVAYGENPWQLWALNITPGADFGVATKLYEVSSSGNISFTNIAGKGWRATIHTNLGHPDDVITFKWCIDGALEDVVTGVDPSSPRNVTPASNPLVSPPQLDVSTGVGRFGWRPNGSSDPFTYINYTVNYASPIAIESLVPSNDGVMGNGAGYLGVFQYHEPLDNHSWYGAWTSGLSEGPRLNVGGTVYMSGYPNGVLWRFNPDAGWALGTNPPSTATNPVQLGFFGLNGTQFAGIKYTRFLAWSPATSKLYCAGDRERNGTGMGVGLYDVVGNSFDGTYELAGMDHVLASGLVVDDTNSLVIASTRNISGTGSAPMYVFASDLSSASTYTPLAFADLGQIFPTSTPGIIFGVLQSSGSAVGLYRFNAVTGSLLVYAEAAVHGVLGAATQNPDGSVWVVIGTQLVKVDPETLAVTLLADISAITPVEVSAFASDGTTLFMAGGAPNNIKGAQLYSFVEDVPEEPTSGSAGISKSFFLGTVSPRPVLPPWRQIAGPTGSSLTDIRNVLATTLTQDHLWGNHVQVTFTSAGTAVKINTGLGGPLKGYKVVRADADIRVWDASPGAPSEERGVHWLQSSGAGKVTLYVY